jgi:transposase InsO family protein
VLRKMVTCLPYFIIEHQEVCKNCANGKNVKVSFPSSISRSKKILDLVHSDVSGPMLVPYASGFWYYVIFTDDYSRRTWIFFIKTKDEAFSCFKEFKALVENQTKKKIKVLSSNNGGEYTSNEFNNFFKKEGIKKEQSIPFNPQQNGVVERKNQTTIEAAKEMLHDQDLPLRLWE